MAKAIPLDGYGSLPNDLLDFAKDYFSPKYIKIQLNYLPDFLIDLSKQSPRSKTLETVLEILQPKLYIMLNNGQAYEIDVLNKSTKKITPDPKIFQPSPFQQLMSNPLTYVALGFGIFLLVKKLKGE